MMVGRLNAALGTRYRVETEIGEGGMANVFLAEDLKHRRKVALKVLKPELAYRSVAGEMIATRVSVGTDGGFVVGASDVLLFTDEYYSYDFQPQWDVAPDGDRFLMIRLPGRDEDQAPLVLVRNWLTEVAERVVRP